VPVREPAGADVEGCLLVHRDPRHARDGITLVRLMSAWFAIWAAFSSRRGYRRAARDITERPVSVRVKTDRTQIVVVLI
jgi:hypothetical protein